MSIIETPPLPAAQAHRTIYNQVFWIAYTANVLLVTANALTFRFAELIAYLGGTEQLAGSIVSTGVIGALVARLVLGQTIDRYGTRKLWMLASVTFVAGCGMFLIAQRLSWMIYLARIAFAIGMAGMFTCSMVHIQNQVPATRRTEVMGTLGSSGFIGMIVGTQLGDLIFRVFGDGRPQLVVLFGAATVLGILYLAVIVFLTRHDVHDRPHETPAAHRLIFRYWPGMVTLVVIMMGVGFTVISVFLTRFATNQNLSGIGTFFTAFALSAFVFRIASRGWSRTIGRHRMILLGLSGQCFGFCVLPEVTRDWHFIIPALGCGLGHALLFPAAISLGSGAFPKEYRGTGTTIVLGFTEVGAMLSGPLLGGIIVRYGFASMFYTAAGIFFSVGVVYGITSAHKPDDDQSEHDRKPSMQAIPTPHHRETAEQEQDESISVPFPHLGRSA